MLRLHESRKERSMHDISPTDLDPLDRIDRSIEIAAPAERVWDLVSRPGWWLNEGAVRPEPDLAIEGSDAVLQHPTYGEFRLQVLESRPPTYVSYRWIDPGGEAGTLVEFWIEPREAGGRLPRGGGDAARSRERVLAPGQGARGLARAPQGQRRGLGKRAHGRTHLGRADR